jgi:hypothetical protein
MITFLYIFTHYNIYHFMCIYYLIENGIINNKWEGGVVFMIKKLVSYKILFLVLFVFIILHVGIQNYKTTSLESKIQPFLPNASIKITRIDNSKILSAEDINLKERINTDILNEQNSLIFVNNLELGRNITLYYFIFDKKYTYLNVNLGKKERIPSVYYPYKGFAFVDSKTNELLKLKVSYQNK